MNEAESKDSYGHVLKYTGIFGGVQGLNIIMGIARNKLTALLLGPAGMGMAALFNSVITFISQATGLGLSFSAVRHISEIFDSGDSGRITHFVKIVRAWSLVAASVGMLVCMMAGPLLNSLAFSWGDHTLHFILLSPAVAMLAVTGGETAILKGARQLRQLAVIQILSVMASLVISVPVYWLFGMSGIVPVILLFTLANMLFTLRCSCRLYPLRLRGAAGILGEGMEMVRLGVAFTLSGIMTSGAEMVIRSFLNVTADLGTVGLYNAGYTLTVTYAGMVFSAMETDYFPRLSSVNSDHRAMTLAANRQAEVSLLILSPMLTLLIAALPVLIPLLYSGKFAPVVPMSQIAVLSMYLKAVTLPVAYMTLAKGHSVAFFVLEAVYAAVFVPLTMLGFNTWGLAGTGIALLTAHVFDLLMIYVYAGVRYGYRVSAPVMRYALIQIPLGAAAYMAASAGSTALCILLGACVTLASTAVSVSILYKKTSLWNRLKERLLRK